MIQLDEQTRAHLHHKQKENKDNKVVMKVTIVLMLDSGCSPELIARVFDIDDSTVYRYQKLWLETDPDTYIRTNYTPYSGKLSEEQKARLITELRQNLYINSQEVADYIKQSFGISYTCEAIVKMLHRLGFVYKKTRLVPSKADTEKQEEFVEELQKLLKELDENEVVYFNDAVHPQHNTRADYGWIFKGEDFEIPANPGRRRININGALNA